MEPVTVIEGTALPIHRSDVDADQIVPAEYLKRIERTGFGECLFAEWRKDSGLDLDALTVSAPGLDETFDMEDFTRWRLLEDLVDIGLSLRNEDMITAYEASLPSWLPTA